MIMAIDPGIADTGYAIGGNNYIAEVGIIKTYPKDGSDFIRCQKITKEIEKKIKKYGIKKMFIEDYKVYGDPIFNTGKRHGEKTIKVISHLELLAEREGIEWEIINHNNWKANFSRIWKMIVMSGKFPELEKLYMKLDQKANYTKKGTKRKGKKEDHDLDAFKMLIPKIINFSEVIK